MGLMPHRGEFEETRWPYHCTGCDFFTYHRADMEAHVHHQTGCRVLFAVLYAALGALLIVGGMQWLIS